ncbi:hypothetical protein BV898_02258 [Hypsibius exemplaris]|uniref:Uncharacterized protein n=1 Tax=Hypsibius exemplaris TaxID=2072580 RepID=A0A1W0X940_HYPEX|nr:hypothetical protein BV898_02258 [Hypsibius exemplaris]
MPRLLAGLISDGLRWDHIHPIKKTNTHQPVDTPGPSARWNLDWRGLFSGGRVIPLALGFIFRMINRHSRLGFWWMMD